MVDNSRLVFLDANVLYSGVLRDWFCNVYLSGGVRRPFDVRFSEDVLAEVLHSLRKSHPEWDGGRIARVREQLLKVFPGALVRDYEVDGSWPGSDEHDGHVHAAAVTCAAAYLVTNDKGFHAPEVSDLLPYEVYTADSFLTMVDDYFPKVCFEAVRLQFDYHRSRFSEFDLGKGLRDAGAPQFAKRVIHHLRMLPD